MTGARRVYGAPRLPSWLVSRPHLVGLLDDASALVVVRGPGGGGKTVLLAEWAQTSADPDLRGAWYDLGDRDVTRRGFWAGVAGRLVDAGLVGPGDLLATASASMREVGDVRAFLVRALEQVGPVTLVLDTVDRLDDETTADLLHVLGAVPSVRAIVAGRSASRLAAPEVRLRLDVRVVDADALALSTAETARLLGVDDKAAATARQATGGSPLVTRALALEREHTGHLDPAQAVESLVLSAVTSLEPDVVGLLRRTVVADAVSVDLAEDLTGRADAAALLDQAEALGLGTWNRPGHERVFTYTTVVRAALRADLRRSSPELFAELRGRVALWADTHDRPVEALEAAVDAGDVPLANTIVRNHWRGFLTEYAGTVRRTVSPLGLVRLRRHPLLVFFVALGFNADKRGRARAIALFGLAVASARVARSTVPPEERLVLRAVEMIALRLTGRGGAAAGAADDVVRRIDDLTLEQHAQILDLLPQVYAHCGIALLHARRPTDAVAAFERGLGEVTTALAALPNLALLAGTHALEGSVSRARTLVEDARGRSWPEGWVDGYTGSLLQVAEALLAVEEARCRDGPAPPGPARAAPGDHRALAADRPRAGAGRPPRSWRRRSAREARGHPCDPPGATVGAPGHGVHARGDPGAPARRRRPCAHGPRVAARRCQGCRRGCRPRQGPARRRAAGEDPRHPRAEHRGALLLDPYADRPGPARVCRRARHRARDRGRRGAVPRLGAARGPRPPAACGRPERRRPREAARRRRPSRARRGREDPRGAVARGRPVER